MHPILPAGSIVAVDRSVTDPLKLHGQIVAARPDGVPMIRWLDVSGRHVILRPNQITGEEFPLIPVEYDEQGTQLIIGQVVWSWSRFGQTDASFCFFLAFGSARAILSVTRASVMAGRRRRARLRAAVSPHSAMASSDSVTGSMPPPRVAPFEPDQLWQQAREPIFWLDPALKLIWVNRAWEKLTGYPAESVVGLTCQAHGPTGAGDLADLAASFHPPPESLAGQPAGTQL